MEDVESRVFTVLGWGCVCLGVDSDTVAAIRVIRIGGLPFGFCVVFEFEDVDF